MAIQDAIAKKQEELNKAYEPLRAKLLAQRSELEAELNDIASKLETIDRKTGKTTPAPKGKGQRHRRTAEEKEADAKAILAIIVKNGKGGIQAGEIKSAFGRDLPLGWQKELEGKIQVEGEKAATRYFAK